MLSEVEYPTVTVQWSIGDHKYGLVTISEGNVYQRIVDEWDNPHYEERFQATEKEVAEYVEQFPEADTVFGYTRHFPKTGEWWMK